MSRITLVVLDVSRARVVHYSAQAGEVMVTTNRPSMASLRDDPALDPLVGTVVNGKFRVLGVVATGGMGRIYRAEQIPLGRAVALKVLNPQYTKTTQDTAFHKRFFLEASILSKLQHPCIVTVFDYGRIEGTAAEAYFMAMEFLVGETLLDRLRKVRIFPPQDVVGIAKQLARGLREAHRQGVVHRDLKPSNIMLLPQDDGTELVKIVDFGLVKVLSDDSDQVTKAGTFLGSPRYMSPEQITQGRMDHRTDIYSLGVILYQMLCGHVPFDSDHAMQTLMAHLQMEVPAMRDRDPSVEVPEILERFVRRCLEKDPDNRPTGMDEVSRELRVCETTLMMPPSEASLSLRPSPPQSGSGPNSIPRIRSYGDDFTPSDIRSGPIVRSNEAGSSPRDTPVVQGFLEPEQPTLAVEPQPSPHRPFWPLVASFGGIMALAGGWVLAWGRQAEQPQDRSDARTSVEGAEQRLTFTLSIESTPAAAEVLDGEALLGRTPLQITIDNASVRQVPRKLTVQLAGHRPQVILQGPSPENVRVMASLEAEPERPTIDAAATASAVKAPAARPLPAQPRPPATKPDSTKPPDPDIRMQR